jgi:hypothetical protein
MAVKLVTKKPGKATISVQHKGTGVEQTTQQAVGEPKTLEGATCNVGIEASMTINLGDYNSVRIGCSLHLPCYHDEIDEVFDFGKQWVDEKMQQLRAEVDGSDPDGSNDSNDSHTA